MSDREFDVGGEQYFVPKVQIIMPNTWRNKNKNCNCKGHYYNLPLTKGRILTDR